MVDTVTHVLHHAIVALASQGRSSHKGSVIFSWCDYFGEIVTPAKAGWVLVQLYLWDNDTCGSIIPSGRGV